MSAPPVGVIFAGDFIFDIPRMGWVAVGRASKRNERAGPLLCETGYTVLSYSSRTSFISPTLIPNGMPSPGGGGLAEYPVSRSESTVPWGLRNSAAGGDIGVLRCVPVAASVVGEIPDGSWSGR